MYSFTIQIINYRLSKTRGFRVIRKLNLTRKNKAYSTRYELG